jgi:hypothetical protein
MQMIVIKTILFFLALGSTLLLIEDAIEKTILNSKKEYIDFHLEYTTGISYTFSGTLMFFTVIFWTAFYLFNQF